MIDFLIKHWEVISILLAILVNLICCLVFKKKPTILDNSFLSKLLDWINFAETNYIDGTDRKKYVLEKAKEYLGINYEYKVVSNMIEAIVYSRKKKGGSNEN